MAPVKGQMANLRCSPERLRCVVRAPGIYLVPRGDGRVTIGATIEHVGFDETVQEQSVRRMAEAALRLLPEAEAPPQMDMWAGIAAGDAGRTADPGQGGGGALLARDGALSRRDTAGAGDRPCDGAGDDWESGPMWRWMDLRRRDFEAARAGWQGRSTGYEFDCKDRAGAALY